MFAIETAITYFVHKKFGIAATLMPALTSIQELNNIDIETLEKLI